ncbi:sigma-70 family RNA polymerase sigma factor [Anaeromicropila herbilytica]|uniref:RNA polymerase sigma factor SigV n=1 Tax=Anaeromicropila herbilytica TaxID=2785025 RepID=A0A7R7EHK3_9FIRM|nr:sigma-70 family RNA polymerase sigma factor [Anaeromicropila herbilytica]BCN28884.1 RNA polymerase sigma factor SigV [Anaeromicropila herbilytica]
MLRKKDEQSEVVKEYIEKHQEDLYRLAYSYTKNSEDALDVVQESVYKAIVNADKLKNIQFIKTWMYRIVVNESLNYIKKQKKYVSDDAVLESIPYEDKDIADSIPVYNAVQQLEPKLRTVIILRFYEDMKLEDIATVTKSNLSTVKTRLYKSLKVLKDMLGTEIRG